MARSAFLFIGFLVLLSGVSLILDDFIPPLDWAFGARILLASVVFYTCALTVPFPLMLVLAFVIGLAVDDRHMVVEEGSSVEFGYSILLYGLTGSLMQGVRPLFRRGRWELPLLLVGVATAVFLLLEWFLMSFRRRGEFYFPSALWYQVWTTALLSMLISPLLFFLIFKVAGATGFPIQAINEPDRRRR